MLIDLAELADYIIVPKPDPNVSLSPTRSEVGHRVIHSNYGFTYFEAERYTCIVLISSW